VLRKLNMSISDIKIIVGDKGGRLLSDKYENTKTKLHIVCDKGHNWVTDYSSLKRGRWCPFCAKNVKYTLLDIQKLIKNKGGNLISKEFVNSHDKIEIMCAVGHVWVATVASVVSGKWCKVCSGKVKYTHKQVSKIIESEGFTLKSEIYKNNKQKICILCNKGHEFVTTLSKFLQNKSCSICSCSSAQKRLLTIVSDIFPNHDIKNNYKGFGWLNIQGRRQEIDIWVPHLKLAIEYDGEQHFMPVRFGGISKEKSKRNFNLTAERDKNKNKLISINDDVKYFIRFTYMDDISKDYVINTLKKYGVV
jgi:hypothetical protein